MKALPTASQKQEAGLPVAVLLGNPASPAVPPASQRQIFLSAMRLAKSWLEFRCWRQSGPLWTPKCKACIFLEISERLRKERRESSFQESRDEPPVCTTSPFPSGTL